MSSSKYDTKIPTKEYLTSGKTRRFFFLYIFRVFCVYWVLYTVEGDATRGTTTLVYLQLHISLYTGTVHVLSRVAGIHPLVWPPTRDVGRCPQGQSLPCAGEELNSNPGLLICSQVRYLWATSPRRTRRLPCLPAWLFFILNWLPV